MSDNPLQDDPARDARIRHRARLLWEEAGKPAGQDADFQERARELIAMEDHAKAALLPNPMIADPEPRIEADEAELEENLGEFPSRLTDQGDRPQSPQPKHRR
jgi:hypothetical protein